MPNPNDYEKKDDFMSSCISIVMKEGTAKNKEQAIAICNNMWADKGKKEATDNDMEGYRPIAFSSKDIGIGKIFEGTIVLSDMVNDVVTDEMGERKYTVVDAVVAVGDRFYGNLFVPSETLKATALAWGNTYNDISHLGTMYPAGMSAVENIEYVTGYNSDAFFDDSINAIRVKMHINHDAPKYQTWKNFMDVSKDAKRIPNVSIFGFYKAKTIRRSSLPSGVHIPVAMSKSDYVVSMSEIIPVAITTCLKGKCDDAAGCGISTGFTDEGKPCDCVGNVCVTSEQEIKVDEKRLNYLKERIKQI